MHYRLFALFCLLVTGCLHGASVSASVDGSWPNFNNPCGQFTSTPGQIVTAICSDIAGANSNFVSISGSGSASAAFTDVNDGTTYGILKGGASITVDIMSGNSDFGPNQYLYAIGTTSTFTDNWALPGTFGQTGTLNLSLLFEGTGQGNLRVYIYNFLTFSAVFNETLTVSSNAPQTYQIAVPLGVSLRVQNTLNTSASVSLTGVQALPQSSSADYMNTASITGVLLKDQNGQDVTSQIVTQSSSSLPLTAETPEPGTLAVSAMAVAGLAAVRRTNYFAVRRIFTSVSPF
jgi:hypothetical protein